MCDIFVHLFIYSISICWIPDTILRAVDTAGSNTDSSPWSLHSSRVDKTK